MYDFSQEKNVKLMAERGVGFEDVIAVLDARGPITVIDHPNKKKYPHQKIYVIEMDNYIYLIPYERNEDKIVLKTIFPSRKMTRLYGNRKK